VTSLLGITAYDLNVVYLLGSIRKFSRQREVLTQKASLTQLKEFNHVHVTKVHHGHPPLKNAVELGPHAMGLITVALVRIHSLSLTHITHLDLPCLSSILVQKLIWAKVNFKTLISLNFTLGKQ